MSKNYYPISDFIGYQSPKGDQKVPEAITQQGHRFSIGSVGASEVLIKGEERSTGASANESMMASIASRVISNKGDGAGSSKTASRSNKFENFLTGVTDDIVSGKNPKRFSGNTRKWPRVAALVVGAAMLTGAASANAGERPGERAEGFFGKIGNIASAAVSAGYAISEIDKTKDPREIVRAIRRAQTASRYGDRAYSGVFGSGQENQSRQDAPQQDAPKMGRVIKGPSP